MSNQPANMPEWLAALDDPILGKLRLAPKKTLASEHIPEVLKAFGLQHPPARRRIVIALNEMAITLWFARTRYVPEKFAAADADLARLENAVRNLIMLWSKASPYYAAMLKAKILMTPANERRDQRFDLSNIDPGPALQKLHPVVRALRNPNIYSQAFSQPTGRKLLPRALLWEPLFDLMRDFAIEDFGQHQALIYTIRALHLACKIASPDPVAVRQALSAWRKRQR